MKITVIKPTSNKSKGKKRVAAYARVSTMKEEQEESFETQIAYYSTLIAANPDYEFVGMYADQGISATQMKTRPEFMRLVGDAKAGKIDVIYCKSISRFCRNAADCQHIVHELKEKMVEVIFEKEQLSTFNPMSEMVFNFMTIIAQEESRSISENIVWSLDRLAEKGIRHLGGKTPFGYKEVGNTFEPDENAWVIQYIFEKYAEGVDPCEIACYLSKFNLQRKKTNRPINTQFIYEVVRQEFYTGNRTIQKRPHPDYLTHKPDPTREYAQYYIKDSHPALVSQELFDKCQEISKKRKVDKSWHKTHKNYFERTGKKVMKGRNSSPLYGLIICSECGECYERNRSSVRARVPYKKWVWNCKGKEKKICKGTHSIDEEKIYSLIGDTPIESISKILIDRNKNIDIQLI